MAKTTIHIEGLRELDLALGQLPKSLAKGVLRRVLKAAGEPVAAKARGGAPREDLHLYESIDVSTRLNPRQKKIHKEESRETFQEMFIGTNNPAGMQQEFGNSRHGPQPWLRPAWDSTKDATLEMISNSLWAEIEKTATRYAKKMGK